MADSEDNSIYFYKPSFAAAILFTVLYIFPFLYHLYITIIGPRNGKYKRAGFFIPILIGAGLEIAGYAVRCASVKKPENIPLYALSQTLIVICPVFVCASLYLLLGRLIIFGAPEGTTEKDGLFLGWIRVKWLPRIFITLDIFSFLTQGSGSGIAASGDWAGSEKDAGIGVLIGGLALQLATFTAFLVIVISFHWRASQGMTKLEEGMRMVFRGLYIGGFFIMVRSIFRLVEFALGIEAYTFINEWPLYVLEAVPMLLALLVLGWYHPSKWLPAAFGAEDEVHHMDEGRKRRRHHRRHSRSHSHSGAQA